MATLQGQSTSNPCSISQHAATVALAGDQACVSEMAREYRARHDWLVPALDALPGVRCDPGWGTFYAFADITGALSAKGVPDDARFAERLLEEAGVATVPGSGFGTPGYLRLSFACSREKLAAAVDRLREFLAT